MYHFGRNSKRNDLMPHLSLTKYYLANLRDTYQGLTPCSKLLSTRVGIPKTGI
jgi:hypothetical protein